MSENHDSEQALEGSRADSDGQLPAPDEEESSGFADSEPSIDAYRESDWGNDSADGREAPLDRSSAEVDLVDADDGVNQVPSSLTLKIDHVGHDDGVGDSNDAKVTEDAGKEDMFVDAPEELTVYDGKYNDTRKTLVVSESDERLDEKNKFVQETAFRNFDSEMQVRELMDEVEHFRVMLEQAVGEKESIAQECEKEREVFMKEVAKLHLQLKALTDHHSLLVESDGRLVDQLQKAEVGDSGEMTWISDKPLDGMIDECSEFLRSALSERSQTDGTIRELHAILFMKNQEIEDLSAKVTELSVSHDVVASYLNSAQETWSQSLNKSLEIQVEKDQHIHFVANRILASLAMVIDQEELADESIAGKMSHIEKKSSVLIENYMQFLSESSELRQKEVDLVEKLSHLESENKLLLEQLEKSKEIAEVANVQLGKIRTELDQEKNKYANVKEKLNLAVTKGKALVQQRDSLRQSLADKTSELEKCVIELQEKSSALEVAELSKVELIESNNLVASLQGSLSQRDVILEKFEEILSQTSVPEGLQLEDSMGKLRWLVDARNELAGVSSEFQKLRDALSLIDLPENVSSSDLGSKISWLGESFYGTTSELSRLKDESSRMREAAYNEIDRITAALSAEIQEKAYLQMELDDLTCKYEEMVKKERQVSFEKDQTVKMLLEASGITIDNQEEVYQASFDMAVLVEGCFREIKEQSIAAFKISHIDVETYERIQCLLYVRDQELNLCEQILEEELLQRSEVNHISNELKVVSQELQALKEGRSSLLKDLERSEEKSALLREKLSMAVKKGKGLVQERENMKILLDEKKTEIEKLRLKLQQNESALVECRDHVSRLSTDLERISKLEAELVAMKDQNSQLEQFLVDGNDRLQRVIKSIDSIILPVDSVFEVPEEKVKWLAGYLNECQFAKTHAEEELGRLKEEADTLAGKLTEAKMAIKSLEDTLTISESNVSQLVEGRRELEVGKAYIEQQLQKAIEEANSQSSKFSEACSTKKSLEDMLSQAENNICELSREKEDAQAGRAAAETELEKVKEDIAIQTSKLTEAYKHIKSLEDELSQVKTNVALLAEEKNDVQVGRTSLEDELKKLKEEASSHAGKLADAQENIKSLEEVSLKAENNISVLVGEKNIAEQEILTLNSKLNACMEELAGTRGNVESRSQELFSHLNSLQMLMKDETLLSLLRRTFEEKINSLKDMDLLLRNIRNQLVHTGSGLLENHHFAEVDSYAAKLISESPENIMSVEIDDGNLDVADGDNISSCLIKTVEGFHLRNKTLIDKFEGFSTFMDDFIASLLGELQATKHEVIVMLEHLESLKQKVKNMEIYKQEQENMIANLENDIAMLLSGCSNATQKLQCEFDPELVTVNRGLFAEKSDVGGDAVEHQEMLNDSQYVEMVEKLLFAAKKSRALNMQFINIKNVSDATIEDLKNKLQETQRTSEKALEESDLNQDRISKLESEVKVLQDLRIEMEHKLQDCQAREDVMKEREAELSLLYNTVLAKQQEEESHLLSASEMKLLFDKTNGIAVPFLELEAGDQELHNSANLKKLFYIIDSIPELQHQIKLLSRDKDELHSNLTTQLSEIKHLKEEAEINKRDEQEMEKLKSKLFELALGLEKIIQKLGGNDSVGDRDCDHATELLAVLEKLVTAITLESENSKSEVQELGVKLFESQKLVDELSTKVKLLEDSMQERALLPGSVQERSIYEAPSMPSGSEIAEVEDLGSVGKKAISPVPSAAHVRTMRKGSSDHLALNIDPESDRLINHEETDEDKGHVFKSLNTSGLIPRQGKTIADRIDGIWVSGGRVLMSRPRARLGLIVYWLILHVWLLGTLL
ncbi:trans-Golgi network-localized SYP41-interacting protein 1 [Malania oleifera]|uniref:trans-Golgi network-localized SYP41-interacting protein 1 n=1 Tax=Malania oleifera TaxID=397392 RepID=UPI0025ADD24A|nr:trans-Golgi network-localized SYP41-interacting protein 1 [Malania oleifera]